jgi:hypothetical protein
VLCEHNAAQFMTALAAVATESMLARRKGMRLLPD